MMASEYEIAEDKFEETLRSIFGPRCSEFTKELRDRLRAFYCAAHIEGTQRVLITGELPLLEPGTTVPQFTFLRPGTYFQNRWLKNHGQVRKILSVTYTSVVLDVNTGVAVTQEIPYTEQEFTRHQPYIVMSPLMVKDPAA